MLVVVVFALLTTSTTFLPIIIYCKTDPCHGFISCIHFFRLNSVIISYTFKCTDPPSSLFMKFSFVFFLKKGLERCNSFAKKRLSYRFGGNSPLWFFLGMKELRNKRQKYLSCTIAEEKHQKLMIIQFEFYNPLMWAHSLTYLSNIIKGLFYFCVFQR